MEIVYALNRICAALVGVGICIFIHMWVTSVWLKAIYYRLDRMPKKPEQHVE